MPRARNHDLKIVVIDDSDLSRRTIIEILEREKFNVVGQTGSPEEAVQIAVNTGANLFLIDVVMPSVSGIEVAKHLGEQLNNIYMVMMSSLHSESILIDSISNGAIDFLQKPFTEEELINCIEKVEYEFTKDS